VTLGVAITLVERLANQLVIAKPETVIAWHRKGFRLFWTWKSRRRTGRPPVKPDVRALIRTMSHQNPLWGAPRIHGELLKLGITVSQATVAKYIRREITPSSQSWRTFLANHLQQIAAADFFVVPTATYRLLVVLVILAHERRRIVAVAVTDSPTAVWTARQLRDAFPWDEASRYMVHDRDGAFNTWGTTAAAMGIEEVLTAVRSPWQKRVRRAPDRIDSPRMPRSCHRGQRAGAEARASGLRPVLPHISNAPLTRQGLADITSNYAACRRRDRHDSACRWLASPLRAPRGVAQAAARSSSGLLDVTPGHGRRVPLVPNHVT
jgi:hypothetical protein